MSNTSSPAPSSPFHAILEAVDDAKANLSDGQFKSIVDAVATTGPDAGGSQRIWDRPPATQQQFESLLEHLQQTLEKAYSREVRARGASSGSRHMVHCICEHAAASAAVGLIPLGAAGGDGAAGDWATIALGGAAFPTASAAFPTASA